MTETRQQRRAREREAKSERGKQDKQLSRMVGGRVDGKEFHDFAPWDGQGVPTRDNCDPANPRQAFLWMFTAPPGMQGAPLMMPTEYWELMSWRMWVLGARPAEEPTQKWQAPVNMAANAWMAAGKWVPLDTPEPERKTLAEAMRELPQAERAAIKAEVMRELGLSDGDMPTVKGRAVPPGMGYTVAALAERVSCPVPEMLSALEQIGLPNLEVGSLVGREAGDRVIAHLGLD